MPKQSRLLTALHLMRNIEGAAAVEMSIILPVLAFAFISMVDVAMAINNRMHLDSALRGAAEAALADPGIEHVEKVFATTKLSSPEESEVNYSQSLDFNLDVERYCTCPGSGAKVSCTTVCGDASIPYLFYELNGDAAYAGNFLKNIPVSRTIVVQIR